MSNADDHAYPASADAQAFPSTEDLGKVQCWGLTKRELFAGLAMAGMLANSDIDYESEPQAAEARKYADALLAELDKPQEQELEANVY